VGHEGAGEYEVVTVRLGVFCKSFRRDLGRVRQLLDTVQIHDRDGWPVALSVPAADEELFRGHLGGHYPRLHLVTDEFLVGGPITQSWRSQQIVKLHLDRLDLADAWLLVDSDFYFVRDFTVRDFVDDQGRLGFVVSRERLAYEPSNPQLMSHVHGSRALTPLTREALLALAVPGAEYGTIPAFHGLRDALVRPTNFELQRRIRRVFRRQGSPLEYMPGPVWSRHALARFRAEFLSPRGLDARKLIEYSPWEYVWLGEWMIANGCANVFPMEPVFLHFDSDAAIAHAKNRGLTKARIAERYLGIALAAGHTPRERFDST
jgi:hypothetical protein